MRTKTLVIVVSKEMGIFLGNYEKFPLWSKCDPLGSTKVYGFRSMEDAKKHVNGHMSEVSKTIDFFEITCHYGAIFVDVVDIIKAGHGDITKELFMSMPTPSTAIN